MVNFFENTYVHSTSVLLTYASFSKSTENKTELCRELHKLFRTAETYQKLVLAHDTARIVQCMLKRAPAEICQEISEVITHFFLIDLNDCEC